MIDLGSRALKPVENYITNYYKLWDKLEDPSAVKSWHAMNTWMSDYIPVAGGAYRQLIDDLYRNNRLIKNELQIGGETVDLRRLRANLLTVIAERDHITPPCQSENILEKVGSADKEIFRVPGGHIGIMAGGRTAPTMTWPHINAWLGARSGEVSKAGSTLQVLRSRGAANAAAREAGSFVDSSLQHTHFQTGRTARRRLNFDGLFLLC